MTVKLEKCPACGELAETLPSGKWAECPECGLQGCEDCIPGGRGCLCQGCEEDIELDLTEEAETEE